MVVYWNILLEIKQTIKDYQSQIITEKSFKEKLNEYLKDLPTGTLRQLVCNLFYTVLERESKELTKVVQEIDRQTEPSKLVSEQKERLKEIITKIYEDIEEQQKDKLKQLLEELFLIIRKESTFDGIQLREENLLVTLSENTQDESKEKESFKSIKATIIVATGAIAVGKTTALLEIKDFFEKQGIQNLLQLKILELEEKINEKTIILFDRAVPDTIIFKINNIQDIQQMEILRKMRKDLKSDKQISEEYLVNIYDKYEEMIEMIYSNYIEINNNHKELNDMLRTIFIKRSRIENENQLYDETALTELSIMPPEIPINLEQGYTIVILFMKRNETYYILTSQRINTTIYQNQYQTCGSKKKEFKDFRTCTIREAQEEINLKLIVEKIQLILKHTYYSHNKSGTKPTTNKDYQEDKINQANLIQILTYLY
ncbi:511_t:CDS:2 [Cetraspora pellucida]|uniref:511_t:CDS:1 n=1 Tax=Cetraspora pellucida TaxID=1433469 RepID=A0A9N9AZ18_9GLOM|nr:511_t:CDS:2 [Cetraspora pellucida]